MDSLKFCNIFPPLPLRVSSLGVGVGGAAKAKCFGQQASIE